MLTVSGLLCQKHSTVSTTAACFPPSGWQPSHIFCLLTPPDPSFNAHKSPTHDLLSSTSAAKQVCFENAQAAELKRILKKLKVERKKLESIFENKAAWNFSQKILFLAQWDAT